MQSQWTYVVAYNATVRCSSFQFGSARFGSNRFPFLFKGFLLQLQLSKLIANRKMHFYILCFVPRLIQSFTVSYVTINGCWTCIELASSKKATDAKEDEEKNSNVNGACTWSCNMEIVSFDNNFLIHLKNVKGRKKIATCNQAHNQLVGWFEFGLCTSI